MPQKFLSIDKKCIFEFYIIVYKFYHFYSLPFYLLWIFKILLFSLYLIDFFNLSHSITIIFFSQNNIWRVLSSFCSSAYIEGIASVVWFSLLYIFIFVVSIGKKLSIKIKGGIVKRTNFCDKQRIFDIFLMEKCNDIDVKIFLNFIFWLAI